MRVILAEFDQPYWVRAIKDLACTAGWEPVYWVASEFAEALIRKTFPGAVFHENLSAARGEPPPECSDLEATSIDEQLLSALAKAESHALKLMDRMDPSQRTFSYMERIRHYHHLLGYWSGVLDRFGPDLVAFPITPHLVYDFVLYSLCKHRGIPTVMFERSGIPGYALLVEDIEAGPLDIRERFQFLLRTAAPSAPLQPAITHQLARLRQREDGGLPPAYTLRLTRLGLRNESQPERILETLRYEWGRIRGTLSRRGFSKGPRVYLKRYGPMKPVERTRFTWSDWLLQRAWAWTRRRSLRQRYEELERPADISQPYVLLALHYQPERNTAPLGGHFAHQKLVAQLIAHNLPKGWTLYVKEHRWQHQLRSRGELGREPLLYDDLARLPNTRLIPIAHPTFDLIDHAQAVATIAGSVGWEALVNEKPVLLFGPGWYQDCEGVFRVNDGAGVRHALSQIAGGYRLDPDQFLRYLQAFQDVAVRTTLELALEPAGELTEKDCRRGIADALRDFAERRLAPPPHAETQ